MVVYTVTGDKVNKMLSSLKLGQIVWYAGINCTIDSLNSGYIYKGSGDIRIFPTDRKLHEIDGHSKLAADGKWIDKDDSLFSTKRPPEKIIFPKDTKFKQQKYSLTKYTTLLDLLKKESLLLKVPGYADITVWMDNGHICTKNTSNGTNISDVEIMYFITRSDTKDVWYRI